MRVMVMFDLPTETSMDRRRYRWFRKYLIDDGSVMMQESIYTKICLNMHAVRQVEANIIKNKPPKGLVQVMSVTERQFASMKLIVGELDETYIQNDARLVVL
ncbi:CRISPR-associated endonuclease Cas2 [Candidatus Saccharibacteria bacterium]|nr:CRISPR-associated endonuclease Cas2 [Candidatus Saccharibacteria bacterium]